MGTTRLPTDVRVFLGIVFGLPWALWVFEQVTGVRILFFAAMLSVAVATWVAARYVWRPVNIAEATALVPVRPIRRTAGYCMLAFVLFIAMSALAVTLNAVTGLYPVDLDGFSALRDVYGPETAGQAGVPWELIGQALAANLAQFALILPLAFWRSGAGAAICSTGYASGWARGRRWS